MKDRWRIMTAGLIAMGLLAGCVATGPKELLDRKTSSTELKLWPAIDKLPLRLDTDSQRMLSQLAAMVPLDDLRGFEAMFQSSGAYPRAIITFTPPTSVPKMASKVAFGSHKISISMSGTSRLVCKIAGWNDEDEVLVSLEADEDVEVTQSGSGLGAASAEWVYKFHQLAFRNAAVALLADLESRRDKLDTLHQGYVAWKDEGVSSGLSAAMPPATEANVTLSGTPSVSELGQRRHLAVLIGIDAYQHVTPLKNAVADCKAIAATLRDCYAFQTVELYNAQASRARIYPAIRKVVTDMKEGDNLLIYYAGHGWEDRILKEGYWIPFDGQDNDQSSFVSNAEIHKFIAAMEKAQHVLVVADSCFSGSFLTRSSRGLAVRPSGSTDEESLDRFFRKMDNRKSRWVFTSGSSEPVPDGGRDGHSVFGYYFLRALSRPDSQIFTASELINRVQKVVANNAPQTPLSGQLTRTGHENGQMIFTWGAQGAASSSANR